GQNRIVSINTQEYFKGDPLKEFEYDFWIEGLTKMKYIEEYYDICFILGPIDPENTMSLYANVDYVYRGISLKPNCHREFSGWHSSDTISIDSPILLESGDIRIPTLRIHNITFKATKIYLPVGEYKVSDKPFMLDACAVFEPEIKKTRKSKRNTKTS
ncbi:MAG: hypothetical protein IKZ82_00495, partial [Clostridia bacterium]|nr:hypothetical protein [Clostridia bacterium]